MGRYAHLHIHTLNSPSIQFIEAMCLNGTYVRTSCLEYHHIYKIVKTLDGDILDEKPCILLLLYNLIIRFKEDYMKLYFTLSMNCLNSAYT